MRLYYYETSAVANLSDPSILGYIEFDDEVTSAYAIISSKYTTISANYGEDFYNYWVLSAVPELKPLIEPTYTTAISVGVSAIISGLPTSAKIQIGGAFENGVSIYQEVNLSAESSFSISSDVGGVFNLNISYDGLTYPFQYVQSKEITIVVG